MTRHRVRPCPPVRTVTRRSQASSCSCTSTTRSRSLPSSANSRSTSCGTAGHRSIVSAPPTSLPAGPTSFTTTSGVTSMTTPTAADGAVHPRWRSRRSEGRPRRRTARVGTGRTAETDSRDVGRRAAVMRPKAGRGPSVESRNGPEYRWCCPNLCASRPDSRAQVRASMSMRAATTSSTMAKVRCSRVPVILEARRLPSQPPRIAAPM